ncbi:unnamed protein product [Owenia fusiformis]|uniref:OTU domain-containing protein n=1 Tax=Owenia fusiformis TaxID=6347 RepID=A0A8S4N7P4_OWEFU|nr:unnamed protein product [Owenia fusiformis]
MGNSIEQWRGAIGTFNPRGSIDRTGAVAEVLRQNPRLLVIITVLLMIGGIESNPGPTFQYTASLAPVAERHGLVIIENNGIGDCLFESLADQLLLLTSLQVDKHDLRQRLVTYIREHPTLPNGEHVMTMFDAEKNVEWQSYLANREQALTDDIHSEQLEWYTNDYMAKPGVWGDNVIIYAFTQLCDIDVVVYTAGVDEPYTVTANDENEERKIARLGYIPHFHFVSLLEKKCVVESELSEDEMKEYEVNKTMNILSNLLSGFGNHLNLIDDENENNGLDSTRVPKTNTEAAKDLDQVISMPDPDRAEQRNDLENPLSSLNDFVKQLRKSCRQHLEKRSNTFKKGLKEDGSQPLQEYLDSRKDAASDSVRESLLKELEIFKQLCQLPFADTRQAVSCDDVTKEDGVLQLESLLNTLVKREEKTMKAEKKKGPNNDVIQDDSNREATSAMFELGKQITACDQKNPDELAKQAQLMVELADLYAALANETKDGWHFAWAAALYNAALKRLQRENRFVEYDNELLTKITDAFQNIETDFLQVVPKKNNESTIDCTERYKKALAELREYSNKTVNSIHTDYMQVDGETFDMSSDNEIKTISHSKEYYDKLTGKIIEFHGLLIKDCISVLGNPNCRYAWLGLGSLARKEATAWSDLESAIIYDPAGKTDEEIIELKKYFRVLAHYLHLKIISLGETRINGLDIPVLNDFNSKLPIDMKDNDFWDDVTPQGLCFDGAQPKASKTPFGRKSTKDPNKSPTFELIRTLEEMAECQSEEVSIKEEAIQSLTREKDKLSINVDQNREKLDTIRKRLASLYESQGKYGESLKQSNERLGILKKNQDSDPLSKADTLNALGIAHKQRGELDKAIKCYEEALAIQRKIHGNTHHPHIANSLNNIGSAYSSKGEYDKAIQYYEESQTMQRLIYGNHPHPDIASSLNNIGSAYSSKGEYCHNM